MVGDDLVTAAHRGLLEAVTLELILVCMTSLDALELELNGRTLPPTVPSELPMRYIVGPGPNAMQGNYAFRYDVGEAGWIKQGWNEVKVLLRKRNPRVEADLVLHCVTLEIKYRILPMRT